MGSKLSEDIVTVKWNPKLATQTLMTFELLEVTGKMNEMIEFNQNKDGGKLSMHVEQVIV